MKHSLELCLIQFLEGFSDEVGCGFKIILLCGLHRFLGQALRLDRFRAELLSLRNRTLKAALLRPEGLLELSLGLRPCLFQKVVGLLEIGLLEFLPGPSKVVPGFGDVRVEGLPCLDESEHSLFLLLKFVVQLST